MFTALPGTDLAKALPDFVLTNAAPLRARATTSELRIENARFKAPETDLTLDGAIALTAQSPLNLRVQGSVNLALARTFSKDFTSSGVLALNATVRGDLEKRPTSVASQPFATETFTTRTSRTASPTPTARSRSTARAPTFRVFTPKAAAARWMSRASPALTGGLLNFRLEAKAEQVRIRYPEGVSSISDASFTLAGSSQRSEVSGAVTIHRVSINPRSDAANILGSTVEPIKTPAVKTGIFSNMNLDVRILTAPDVALQTSVAQSIEADANPHLARNCHQSGFARTH